MTAPIGAVVLYVLATLVHVPAPAFDEVRAAWRPSDRRLLDRHGEVIHETRVDPTRRRLGWTPLAEVSPALASAVVRSEDRSFFRHRGIDTRAVAAAAVAWLRRERPRGASTISMQVAALIDPDLRRRGGPRTFAQKWRQMKLAWALEARWSKAEILESYLNLVTFRGELQGVAAAAAGLFGKAPDALGDPEAAVMAALLRAPAAGVGPVVRRARALGESEAIEAAAFRALDGPAGRVPRIERAPHAAIRLLGTARGLPAGAMPMTVTSTLDARTQDEATASLRQQILAIRGERVNDGAVLVVDNASGDVLAYVGSSGELSTAAEVDGVTAQRQPGSALKPFLYGLAFARRVLTPASVLDDAPLDVPVEGGVYRPANYDDRYRGPVSARTALASSLNVPAVRTLGLLGGDAFVDHLRRAGFESIREAGDFYGPGLALGSADVTLWELVNAYRTLANGGTWTPLRLRAADAPTASGERRVYAPEIAFLVADVLADRESRSATFGLENALATPFWTAVKTGTSKDMRDNWCVGFSRRYTVGVWVGNFTGEPMQNVSGVTGAAPVWRELITWLHRATPSEPPRPPAALVARTVDFAHDAEPSRTEWFVRGTEPAVVAAAAVVQARIVAPVSGMIIAIDPDIPDAHQRVVFEAHVPDVSTRWALDGVDLGPASRAVLWKPTAGRHALALVDGEGSVRDRVSFVVRGVTDSRGGRDGLPKLPTLGAVAGNP
jgi:penicillin-binding protein 1C